MLKRTARLRSARRRGGARRRRHQDRLDLRLHRPVRGRRLEAGVDRHQDRHRHDQREGRRRGPQDHRHLRRRAVQDRRRHQRGRAPARTRSKVDLLMGVYSSAQCVPMAAKVDAPRSSSGSTSASPRRCSRTRTCSTCSARRSIPTSTARPPARSSPRTPKSKLGKDAEGHQGRHHPRGRPLRRRRRRGQRGRVQGARHADRAQGRLCGDRDRSLRAGDKLRRAQPDVILHTGYNPDITLFLRQAKEQGLKFKALIGHGAGYSQIDKLIETFKDDVNYFLQRRSGGGAAARCQDAQARPRRPHRRDGQALQGGDRRRTRCRRTSRWASTRPGSS